MKKSNFFCKRCGIKFEAYISANRLYCSKHCVPFSYHPAVGFKEGSENPRWSGDKISYKGLHDRIRKALGTPSKCFKCGTTKSYRFEWANISGEYSSDLSDWMRLCVKCHREKDNNIAKAWITRKKLYGNGFINK